jgi:hypothetical protein
MNTASKVAEYKREHPHLYCPVPRCLWRTGGERCPRHKLSNEEMREPELAAPTVPLADTKEEYTHE